MKRRNFLALLFAPLIAKFVGLFGSRCALPVGKEFEYDHFVILDEEGKLTQSDLDKIKNDDSIHKIRPHNGRYYVVASPSDLERLKRDPKWCEIKVTNYARTW